MMFKNSGRFVFQITLILGVTTGCGSSSNPRCAPDHIAHESQLQLASYDAAAGKTLTLCRGGYIPATVTVQIPTDTSQKLTEIDTTQESTFESTRWDGSCDDMDRDRRSIVEAVPVALTSSSFQDIKLCYESSDHMTVSFVEKNQDCPAGDEEQKAPVDDCTSLGTDTHVLYKSKY
jgi:hypothetical protein